MSCVDVKQEEVEVTTKSLHTLVKWFINKHTKAGRQRKMRGHN